MNTVDHLRRRMIISRVVKGFIILAIFALIFGGAYFVYKSPSLRISEINVSGNNTVSKDVIIQSAKQVAASSKLSHFLTEDNILVWRNLNGERLKNSISRLASVSISSDIGDHAINIKVSERKGVTIWCLKSVSESLDTNCYWLDEKGEIFDIAPDATGNLVRVVYDVTGRSFKTNDMPLSAVDLKNFSLVSDFLERWSLPSDTITLTSVDPSELSVKLVTGQSIYFNLEIDPSFGNSVISTIKDSGKWDKVTSLDLRIPGKGFYRLK